MFRPILVVVDDWSIIAKPVVSVKERDDCPPIAATHQLLNCGETVCLQGLDRGAEAVASHPRIDPLVQLVVVDEKRIGHRRAVKPSWPSRGSRELPFAGRSREE
jgi:hypothetical protein